MNRREFATSAAAAALGLTAGSAAHAQGDADGAEPLDFTEAAQIELAALAASGVTVMGENGLETVQLPWARPAAAMPPPAPRGARRGGRPGGSDRSVIVPGTPLNSTPAPLTDYWTPGLVAKPAPVWPADDRACDYRHLSTRTINAAVVEGYQRSSDPGFELSAATLRFLAKANAFPVDALKRPLLVFGLRGCMLDPATMPGAWAPRQRLRVATPNHIDYRCTIGVWRMSDDFVAVWPASTVPEASLIWGFTPSKGYGCSLLPTGFYRYRSGTHGSAARPQRGALRIDQQYVVLRTPSDLSYDPFQADDMWTEGGAHNLHAGAVAGPPKFSSQGCQVIPGGYQRPERVYATGAWKGFRDACGLTGANGLAIPAEAEKQGSFQYMLLTGLEAALYAHGKPDFLTGYKRLRHGSVGPQVKALQERLYSLYKIREPADGAFGMATSYAVLWDKKRTEGEHTSPIMEL